MIAGLLDISLNGGRCPYAVLPLLRDVYTRIVLFGGVILLVNLSHLPCWHCLTFRWAILDVWTLGSGCCGYSGMFPYNRETYVLFGLGRCELKRDIVLEIVIATWIPLSYQNLEIWALYSRNLMPEGAEWWRRDQTQTFSLQNGKSTNTENRLKRTKKRLVFKVIYVTSYYKEDKIGRRN